MEKNTTTTEHNTVYDDTFRTEAKKMPDLFIPLINDCFGTDYPLDEPISQQCNDLFTPAGKLITDSIFMIRNKTYHIECQSTNDQTIALRMIEYDFQIAVDSSEIENGIWEVRFPSSCVLYLRGRSKGKTDKVRLLFPDGKRFDYPLKTVFVRDFTLDEMFEKNLLLLLPFYIMRYESESNSNGGDSASFALKIRCEIEDMCSKLLGDDSRSGKPQSLYYLLELVNRVADHVFRKNEAARREVDEYMGGKILKLNSEIMFEQGEAKGRAEGRSEGLAEGRASALYELASEGTISLDIAAERLGVSVEQLKESMIQAEFKLPGA